MENYHIECINKDGVLSLAITYTETVVCEVKQGADKMTKKQIKETCKSFVDQARRMMVKLHNDQVTNLQNNREFKNEILMRDLEKSIDQGE